MFTKGSKLWQKNLHTHTRVSGVDLQRFDIQILSFASASKGSLDQGDKELSVYGSRSYVIKNRI